MHAATLTHTLRVIQYERSHTNERCRRADQGLAVDDTAALRFGRRGRSAVPTCHGTRHRNGRRRGYHNSPVPDEGYLRRGKVIKLVLENEPWLGTQDEVGLAARHYAAKSGRTSAVKWLLGRGAGAYIRDGNELRVSGTGGVGGWQGLS